MTDHNRLDQLQTAHVYGGRHRLRVTRDLILEHALGKPLSHVIEQAWDAGFLAKQDEELSIVHSSEPPRWSWGGKIQESIAVENAKTLLRLCGDPEYINRSVSNWTWVPEGCGWSVEGDDCFIRPGDAGIIVMEAGGEYAGRVIGPGGVVIEFPEGTFR